jgi:uncharacterized damage-inducible protein DinB
MPPDETVTLIPFYPGWATYQDALVQAVAPLTAEQLALRAAPSLHSIGELAAHISAARAGWFHRTLGEGESALATIACWDVVGAPPQQAAILVDGLEATWSVIHTGLDRWTAAMLDDTFTTRRGRPITRGLVLWHVLEHDLHHGGELSLTLGMHGLPALDL